MEADSNIINLGYIAIQLTSQFTSSQLMGVPLTVLEKAEKVIVEAIKNVKAAKEAYIVTVNGTKISFGGSSGLKTGTTVTINGKNHVVVSDDNIIAAPDPLTGTDGIFVIGEDDELVAQHPSDSIPDSDKEKAPVQVGTTPTSVESDHVLDTEREV